MAHWLLKSEPNTFSIDDLIAKPKHTAFWDGVRNYQARNLLRDVMKLGDTAFFYHSSLRSTRDCRYRRNYPRGLRRSNTV